MTFEEILDQAIAMLQRRGRLTYNTLKRQFQLDDAALEDMKNELIYGQRLAVDEERVLVWRGDPVSAPPPLRAVPDTRQQETGTQRTSGLHPRAPHGEILASAPPWKVNASRSRCSSRT